MSRETTMEEHGYIYNYIFEKYKIVYGTTLVRSDERRGSHQRFMLSQNSISVVVYFFDVFCLSKTEMCRHVS